MEQEIQAPVAPTEVKKNKAAAKQPEAAQPLPPETVAGPAPASRKIGCQNTWQTIFADNNSETRALYIEKLGCLVEVVRENATSITFIDGCKIGKCKDGNPKLIFAG